MFFFFDNGVDNRPRSFMAFKSGIDYFRRNCYKTLEARMNFCRYIQIALVEANLYH